MGDHTIPLELPHQWEQLYIEFSPLLYNYGCKITAQTSLVEDSVHDVFVNLLKNPHYINAIENPKAYLFKSFRRLLINKLKLGSESHELPLHEEHHPFNIEISSEARWILEESSQEQLQKLSHAIQQLSPRQREAVYLKFYGKNSYEEVAGIMKMEKSALYSLIYKSLTQLRKVLSPTFSSKISVGHSLLIHLMGLSLLF